MPTLDNPTRRIITQRLPLPNLHRHPPLINTPPLIQNRSKHTFSGTTPSITHNLSSRTANPTDKMFPSRTTDLTHGATNPIGKGLAKGTTNASTTGTRTTISPAIIVVVIWTAYSLDAVGRGFRTAESVVGVGADFGRFLAAGFEAAVDGVCGTVERMDGWDWVDRNQLCRVVQFAFDFGYKESECQRSEYQ